MIDYDFGVSLGPLLSSHADQARSWRNDMDLMRWCRQRDMVSDGEQTRWFDAQDRDERIKMYAIYAGNTFTGVCGYTSIDRTASHAEFSLYIATEHQNKGRGRAALKTLFNHGFLCHGFNQIWGECFDTNPAMKIFVGLGMKPDGRRRDFYYKNGQLWDAHLVSMMRSEWREQPWCKYLSV